MYGVYGVLRFAPPPQVVVSVNEAVAASPETWPRYGRRARRYVFPRYPFEHSRIT